MQLRYCLCILPTNFLVPKPIFMELCMYIKAPDPISTSYLINTSYQAACLYVYPLIVARQRLGKKNYDANEYTTITEELLDASFSMRSVSYQRKVGD
jgi:uncharacterized protein (DUF486 family)